MNKYLLQDKKLRNFIKIFLTAIIIILVIFVVRDFIRNVDDITRIARSAGIYGPIVLILLTSLGIILTPIPSIALIVAAGYLYGTWLGALYSYLGHLIAAIGTFAIVNKTFSTNLESKRYEMYRKLVEKNKKILYILYAIPVIPISIITIISSSLKIKWKEFLKIIAISFVPTVLFFSYFGEKISKRNLLVICILSLMVLIGVIIGLRTIEKKQKKYKKKDKNKKANVFK